VSSLLPSRHVPTCGNAVTATPAVTSGSQRAVRLVFGATAAAVAALVLVGLLVAVLRDHPPAGAPALGLGLGAVGAAGLATGLLVVARAGALARRPSGRDRAAAVLTRCVLAATVVAVALAVVGVVAVSATRAPGPGVGSGAGAVLLVGLATLAGRSRRRLAATVAASPDTSAAPAPFVPSQRSAEPTPVPGGASEPGPAADAR
jgi:hypothetical protein